MNKLLFWCWGLLTGFVAATPAYAYIGPGAGLSAIGTVLAVIGAFLLLLIGFVWYPVKRMLRGGGKAAAKNTSETAPSTETESSDAATQKRDAKSGD